MTKKIITALALIASTASYAADQVAQPTVTQESAALLGSRYVQAAVGFRDINHQGTDEWLSGVAVNLPVAKGVDVTVSFQHDWEEGNTGNNGQGLDIAGTYFVTEGDTKPFISANVGYIWPNLGDELVWGGKVGVEYAVSQKMSATVSGGYSDNFKNEGVGEWNGSVSGNYAVAKNTFVGAEVSFIEGGDWLYALSATYKF